MTEFDRRKRIPQYWHNEAADLHASAGALWFCSSESQAGQAVAALGLPPNYALHFATTGTMHMLCGLSLELLYKAICAARKVRIPASHRLTELADAAAVPVEARAREVLQFLTEHVIWFGKYPVPREKDRDKLDAITDLHHSLMFEEVALDRAMPGFHIYQRNDVCVWAEYKALWDQAGRIFHAVHEPTE